MSTPLPKLSYVLLSHNREKYIRAAIESAFAQDYEGELEYIFSDDCSTDRTFEIIKECVAEYKGNRRVVVTQTPRNLHLAGNTNHAVQFVTSDWIVRADDDDFSVHNRCSLVGQAIADNPGCTYVYTQMENFTDDMEDVITGKLYIKSTKTVYNKIHVLSGEHDFWKTFSKKNTLHQVWSMKHFREFGPLPLDGYWVDDVIANMRCCALGYGVSLDAVTAYIRNGSANMSRGGDDGRSGYSAIMRLEKFNDQYFNTTHQPLLREKDKVSNYLDEKDGDSFMESIEADLNRRSLLCTFWRKGTMNRISVSRKLGYHGPFAMIRCLPMPVYACILALYRKLLKK